MVNKTSFLRLFTPTLIFFSMYLSAMDQSIPVPYRAPAEDFVYHQCVPALRTLAVQATSPDDLDNRSMPEVLYVYAKDFKKSCNSENTDLFEAAKLKLSKEDLEWHSFSYYLARCFEAKRLDLAKYFLAHAELTQENLDVLLMTASTHVHLPAVKLLDSLGARGEFFSRWQEYSQHDAVLHGDVERITAEGVNQFVNGISPLGLAAEYDQEETVKKIIQHATQENLNKSLLRAALYGAESTIPLLIEHGAQVNAKDSADDRNNHGGWTALHYAASQRQADTIYLLVAHGADVKATDGRGETPLYHALSSCDTVKALIACGADVNAKNLYDVSPLHNVRRYGVAKVLIESGAKVNVLDNVKNTPLHEAADHRSFTVARLLIAYGAPLNAKGYRDMAPIHCALACKNELDIVKNLVYGGVDINAQDGHGETPLNEALRQQYSDTAKFLILQGADVNIGSGWGAVPLHYASGLNNLEMVQLLVAHGARVNVQDRDGETPLHRAFKAGKSDIIVFLIAHGADVTIKNKEGRTPLNVARMSKAEVTTLLEQAEREKQQETSLQK